MGKPANKSPLTPFQLTVVSAFYSDLSHTYRERERQWKENELPPYSGKRVKISRSCVYMDADRS